MHYHCKKLLFKSYILFSVLLTFSLFFVPVSALTELEKVTINEPRLENAFGIRISDNINADHSLQISSDIKNNQQKLQTIVYLVQIKNQDGLVVYLGWISGQLTSEQILSPSLSWTPHESGEFTAELFVWDNLMNPRALTDFVTLQIHVS